MLWANYTARAASKHFDYIFTLNNPTNVEELHIRRLVSTAWLIILSTEESEAKTRLSIHKDWYNSLQEFSAAMPMLFWDLDSILNLDRALSGRLQTTARKWPIWRTGVH